MTSLQRVAHHKTLHLCLYVVGDLGAIAWEIRRKYFDKERYIPFLNDHAGPLFNEVLEKYYDGMKRCMARTVPPPTVYSSYREILLHKEET